MAFKPYQLSKQEISKLNNALDELQAIKEDLERAQRAGVPNVDHLIVICDGHANCIAVLKEEYAGKSR